MRKKIRYFISGIIEMINDSERDISERIGVVLNLIGIPAALIMIIPDILNKNIGKNTMLLIATVFIFAFVLIFSAFSGRLKLTGGIITAYITMVLFPMAYFFSGGLYSGVPLWFILGYCVNCMILRGKLRLFMLFAASVINGVCFYLDFRRPHLSAIRTVLSLNRNVIFSLFLTGAIICAAIYFCKSDYMEKQHLSDRRVEEIKELGNIQNKFFAAMNHDIRSPINTIYGLNEMVLRKGIKGEVARNSLRIQGAGRMLLSLIGDIIDLSKIESGTLDIVPVIFNLENMLADIVNIVYLKARDKGLDFYIKADENIPAAFRGDEIRIKQLLVNILNNAVKYTLQGSVSLKVSGAQKDGDIYILEFSVSDTGIGIKKESLDTLFDSFSRADEEKNRNIEGTGLGLSIVKRLLELMGGDISVESEYGKGSVFTVKLPLERASDDVIGIVDTASLGGVLGEYKYKPIFTAPKARILIVDDDDMNRKVAAMLLKDTGMQIDTAKGGREALELTLRNRYHAILMDHQMPQMDGIETLDNIRNQYEGLCRDVPVMALTANAGQNLEAYYLRAGFESYIPKPVAGKDLEHAILKVIPKELVIIPEDTVYDARNTEDKRLPVYSGSRKSILITTDSGSCISLKRERELGVKVLRSYIRTSDGKRFIEEQEVNAKALNEYLEYRKNEAWYIPPSKDEYREFFRECLKEAYEVIHISSPDTNNCISLTNALEGSKNIMNLHVEEGPASGVALAMAVSGAAKLAGESANTKDIIAYIRKAVNGMPGCTITGNPSPLRYIRLFGLYGGDRRIERSALAGRFYMKKNLSRDKLYMLGWGISDDDLTEIRKGASDRAGFKNIEELEATPFAAIMLGKGGLSVSAERKDREN